MKNPYDYFCSGCGLCKEFNGVSFEKDSSGFEYPAYLNDEQISFCDKYCYAGKNAISKKRKNIWGNYRSVYKGYSLDEKIRYSASSGGVLTAVAVYLLDRHRVDGIIQVRRDPSCPYKTVTVCSQTKEDILSSCGSRYCQSEPLSGIMSLTQKNKKYAFIGKPCDAASLRNYLKDNNELNERIEFIFSFFCAGVPSEKANLRLIKELGCEPDEVTLMDYRGNGWPGKAFVEDKSGQSYTMEYEKSWMEILGRDIRNCCKFCFDGIGEAADVSCGDLWELTDQKKPDFSEKDGCNVVFSRTEKGQQLLEEMKSADQLFLDDYQDRIGELRYVQPNHYFKRSTIFSKIFALKITGRKAPKYKFSSLFSTVKYSSPRVLFGTFRGTVKRLKKGKI